MWSRNVILICVLIICVIEIRFFGCRGKSWFWRRSCHFMNYWEVQLTLPWYNAAAGISKLFHNRQWYWSSVTISTSTITVDSPQCHVNTFVYREWSIPGIIGSIHTVSELWFSSYAQARIFCWVACSWWWHRIDIRTEVRARTTPSNWHWFLKLE